MRFGVIIPVALCKHLRNTREHALRLHNAHYFVLGWNAANYPSESRARGGVGPPAKRRRNAMGVSVTHFQHTAQRRRRSVNEARDFVHV